MSIFNSINPFNKSKEGCAFLLYYRVADLVLDKQGQTVSIESFFDQLYYLKKHHTVLSIEELMHCLDKKSKIPAKSFAISFDRGYSDNYFKALQVLESLDMQALFYVATATIGTEEEFWWDELERIFFFERNIPSKLIWNFNGKNIEWITGRDREKEETYQLLMQEMHFLPATKRNEQMQYLKGWSGSIKPRNTHDVLSQEELKRLSQSKSAVIGAHTHHLVSLKNLPPEEQRNEIATSKKMLEEITGLPVKHFSVPYGTKEDYSTVTIDICRELGFQSVSVGNPALVKEDTSIFEIPRLRVMDWEEPEFKKQIKSWWRNH